MLFEKEFVMLGVFCAALSAFAIISFNRLPLKWFCDYGEPASEFRRKRLRLGRCFIPAGAALFACLAYFRECPWEIPGIAPFPALPFCVILFLLLQISLSDILYMVIPDQHVGAILLAGLFSRAFPSAFFPLAGLAAGIFPFLLLWAAGGLLFRKELVGFGDVKLMGALGFCAGPLGAFQIYLLGSLLGGICSALLLAFRHLKGDGGPSYVPMAPFLSFSAIFCLLPYEFL